MSNKMTATLHKPGMMPQVVEFTAHGCEAAAVLLGLPAEQVKILVHTPGPVNGQTVYVDSSASPRLSSEKYAAKYSFLIVVF